MRIIAFITHSADIRQTPDHIGADCEPPRIAPARGAPLWDDCDALAAEGWHWPMGRDPIVLGRGKEARWRCERSTEWELFTTLIATVINLQRRKPA